MYLCNNYSLNIVVIRYIQYPMNTIAETDEQDHISAKYASSNQEIKINVCEEATENVHITNSKVR